MSNLPGNPYAELAEADIEYPGAWNELEAVTALLQTSAHATLALAYEQRLATLATLFNIPDNSAIPGVDYAEAARQLSEGLGMRAEK